MSDKSDWKRDNRITEIYRMEWGQEYAGAGREYSRTAEVTLNNGKLESIQISDWHLTLFAGHLVDLLRLVEQLKREKKFDEANP